MTYVLSDVHGNKDNFDSIMGKIHMMPGTVCRQRNRRKSAAIFPGCL